MTARFRVTLEAQEDLGEIARYTEQMWGREQRNSYLENIENTFERITTHPAIGQTCDLVRPGYLFIPIGSHLLFYRVTDDNVIEIIRVLHKSTYVISKL
jgi:toxin ParE1/3/4